MILIMTAQVLFFKDFSEKDPHLNAVESGNNGINRAGPVLEGSPPGRCSLVRQRGLGFHPTIARA